MIAVWLSYLPGWALMCVLSLLAMGVSKLVVIGGNQPLEASALAVIFGIILRNAWKLPAPCVPGVKAAEKLLVLGIVLMGFGLNYEKVFKGSGEMLTVILVTMTIGFLSIYLLSRWAKLSEKLGTLLAVGTCICGGTAIALVAPLIKAKEEETSYSVAVIALLGVAAVLIYPLAAKSIGVSNQEFGLFAGTAIHSTPQVVGAGYIFSDAAGELATAVKLIRNCFMAPMALLLALWFSSKLAQDDKSKVSFAKAFPWFLFAYFLTSWLGTQGYVSEAVFKSYLEPTGKFLILLGMAGVGLNTDLGSLRRVGLTPLGVGLVGALIVAAVSAGLIAWFR
ncbi:MAG: putative sulfate exporter family transporter [Gemmatales bacterium]